MNEQEIPAEDANIEAKYPLSQVVYDRLLEKFLHNELVPGNILNRRKIAQDFGVSVAPVLEALLQLEIEGFVESIPRKGTLVKPVRQEDIFGQLMLREAVECQAALLYCGDPVVRNRRRLEILAETLERSPLDTPEHWKQEVQFHHALVELSDCPVLIREFNRVFRLGIFYRINRFLPSMDRQDNQSHLILLDRLTDSDPEKAQRAIREHLRSNKKHLFK